jgi:glycosyltransferase involved in cell wall biosynthesis
MPQVSVVVPNYNHARYLRRRIDTVLEQGYQDIEVILLDDCSTDESRSILQEYASDPRVRLEFNEKNSGHTFMQWNKGVRLARGEYVWIAESDDYAAPEFLERLVGILESDEQIAFAYCRSWRVTDDDQLRGFEDAYSQYARQHQWDTDFCVERGECRKFFLFTNLVPNASAVVFRKSAYESAGGADESLILCGDWKVWAALALAGGMAYTSTPLNYYRMHGDTLRQKTTRRIISVSVCEGLQVVRWILDRLILPDSELVAVYKAHALGWVPELMSTHIAASAKAEMLRHVRALDPHPMRRVVGPAIETVRRSLLRRWRDVQSAMTPARNRIASRTSVAKRPNEKS